MESLASRNSMSGLDSGQVLAWVAMALQLSCSSNVCMSLHLFGKWNTKEYV